MERQLLNVLGKISLLRHVKTRVHWRGFLSRILQCFILLRRESLSSFSYIRFGIYRFSIVPFKYTRDIFLREAIRSRASGIYYIILFSHCHHRVWNAILYLFSVISHFGL